MADESIGSNFTSMHPTVEFLGILDSYPFDADLPCKFRFNDYTPQEGDRVAIYKIGWSYVKDYIVFEWAPSVACKDHQCSIFFNRHILPKNSTEVYQFCYINHENELHGASTPFQFFSGDNLMSVSGMSVSKQTNSIDHITKSQALEKQKDLEICRLNEENAMLRDTLKTILHQNKANSTKNYDKEIKELKELTEGLNLMLLQHQQDIDMLKSKIIEGGEEYKKLYLEKLRVERKYEKLKGKSFERKLADKELRSINDPNFDIGELKSIPPFPSILNK